MYNHEPCADETMFAPSPYYVICSEVSLLEDLHFTEVCGVLQICEGLGPPG